MLYIYIYIYVYILNIAQGFTRGDKVRESKGSVESVRLVKVSDPNCLINDKHPSFHGELTGEEANERLNSKGIHCYLVRYSKTWKCYVLCVRYTKGTRAFFSHITMVVRDKKLWLDPEGEKKEFKSLDDLLSHYKKNSLNEELSNIGEVCESAELLNQTRETCV